MNIKKKTLALMVGIACSGLLYGVNANAKDPLDAFAGNSVLTTIKTDLTSTNKIIADNNLAIPAANVADLSPDTHKEKIKGFDDYKDALTAANKDNNEWVAAFVSALTLDKGEDPTDGLVGRLVAKLNTGNDSLYKTEIETNGKPAIAPGVGIDDEKDAINTLLNLIDLGQRAKAVDAVSGKTENFTKFLKDNGVNLFALNITTNTSSGVLAETVAATTFKKLVTVGGDEGALSSIPLRKVKENAKFLETSYGFISNNANFPNKIEVAIQGIDGQQGANSDVQKLTTDLKDKNNFVIAPTGTALGIKNNAVTIKNTPVSTPAVFAGDKLQTLGKVAIDNSNVQGSGNKVLARSELVVDKTTGVAYNLAEGMTALGNSNVIESNSVTIGNNNTVGENSIALGNKNILESSGVAAGMSNTVGENGIALGTGNKVGKNGTAVGNGSQAGENAIALGYKAEATHKNSIALGSGSKTTQENEINVGMWTINATTNASEQTGFRTITGVADGTDKHAAVNKGQLDKLEAASKLDAETKAGKALEDSKIFTNSRIDDVGKVANTYTDNKVNGLKQEMNSKIDALDKKVNKGFAANAALSGLFQPYGVGKINMTAGVGGYQSESAVAVGVGYRVNENVAVKGGIATAVGNGSSTMYNASVNFEW